MAHAIFKLAIRIFKKLGVKDTFCFWSNSVLVSCNIYLRIHDLHCSCSNFRFHLLSKIKQTCLIHNSHITLYYNDKKLFIILICGRQQGFNQEGVETSYGHQLYDGKSSACPRDPPKRFFFSILSFPLVERLPKE